MSAERGSREPRGVERVTGARLKSAGTPSRRPGRDCQPRIVRDRCSTERSRGRVAGLARWGGGGAVKLDSDALRRTIWDAPSDVGCRVMRRLSRRNADATRPQPRILRDRAAAIGHAWRGTATGHARPTETPSRDLALAACSGQPVRVRPERHRLSGGVSRVAGAHTTHTLRDSSVCVPRRGRARTTHESHGPATRSPFLPKPTDGPTKRKR